MMSSYDLHILGFLNAAGIGKIKNRDNPNMWNTDQEFKLRIPEDAFWKKFAAECSRVQIAVDIFSFWSVPLRPRRLKDLLLMVLLLDAPSTILPAVNYTRMQLVV